MKIKHTYYSNIVALVANLALVYVAYALCRVIFLFDNWDLFRESFADLDLWLLFKGSLRFDTSAIFYINSLYVVLMLFPFHFKECRIYHLVLRWIYVVTNAVAIVANLCDVAYFRFSGRRTTASVFSEFSNENNLTSVFLAEMVNHWYLVLIGLCFIAALWLLYLPTVPHRNKDHSPLWRYYLIQSSSLCLFAFLAVCGMRGGASTAVRPITLSNANQYVNQPIEAGIVLNTPFSIIRSINKSAFVDPQYFSNEELDEIFSPVHHPAEGTVLCNKNVVVLIVESFGREYIGSLNYGRETYTPFIDSLIGESLTFEYTYGNGSKSIDGMPSILSGIPSFVEPFFLTPSSLNDVSSIAGELRKCGYYTAFFHGAENGSMGFEAFARACGFEDYYGRTEYGQDKRFDGDKDFDGTWAIWDEEFLQFYALTMSDFEEPFATSVFTASSHHPFVVPQRYREVYADAPGDDNPLHKCIRYTDNALRRFFETAKQQPWYKNTLFVITADHTNISSFSEYQNSLWRFKVPIIIFDPSGEIKAERRNCIAQQIDIMPTILGYLGYPKSYVSFGQDLSKVSDEETWAVNYSNGIYQYVKRNRLLQMTDNGIEKAFYDTDADSMLTTNIKGSDPELEAAMMRELKAIIQSYMQRMVTNNLVLK